MEKGGEHPNEQPANHGRNACKDNVYSVKQVANYPGNWREHIAKHTVRPGTQDNKVLVIFLDDTVADHMDFDRSRLTSNGGKNPLDNAVHTDELGVNFGLGELDSLAWGVLLDNTITEMSSNDRTYQTFHFLLGLSDDARVLPCKVVDLANMDNANGMLTIGLLHQDLQHIPV